MFLWSIGLPSHDYYCEAAFGARLIQIKAARSGEVVVPPRVVSEPAFAVSSLSLGQLLRQKLPRGHESRSTYQDRQRADK
jgi:hypothetical protein